MNNTKSVTKKFRVLSLAALASLTLFAGCATTTTTPPTRPPTGVIPPSKGRGVKPSPANETAEYRDIQTLFLKGAYEAALRGATQFETRYPKSALLASVENLHGLTLLALKDPGEAIIVFKRALQRPSARAHAAYYLYNLATAQLEANDTPEAAKTLERINAETLDQENQVKFHHLRAQTRLRQQAYFEAAKDALIAARLSSPESIQQSRESHGPLVQTLERALQNIANPGALEPLQRDYKDSPLVDLVLLELVRKELAQGNSDRASHYARMIQESHPGGASSALAAELLRSQISAAPAGPIEPMTIGVLLPLKGKFAKFGAHSLQAIEMALGIFSAHDSDSKITLAIEDSGEEPEQTVAALTRLAQQHRVVAVIGPLLSKGIDQINQRAQELRVPLISLARHTGTPQEYVVQGGLTMKLQAQEIARYAIEELKLRKFAIMAPQDRIGNETARHFWDAVEARGGEVVGFELYSSSETDFRQSVDKLSGLYYTEARQRELDALAKEREVNKIRKRTRKTEQYFGLKPIVEYQAVFIPDEPRVSGQILPTFSYRDVDGVRFLGTAAWNSPEFVTRAQAAAGNSLFVDAFFPQSRMAGVSRFIENYKQNFGQEPLGMDALAYDAADILRKILSRGVSTRTEFLEHLKSVKNFSGVTGRISYIDGQLDRDLKLLTVRQGQVVEAGR